MSLPSQNLSTRLRHYVTLIVAIVPLVVLLVEVTAGNWLKAAVPIIPLFLTALGALLELARVRVGRLLTLVGLGLQALGAISLVVAVFVISRGVPAFRSGGVGTLALMLAFVAVPVLLLAWNLRAGRGRPPELAGAA